MNDQKLKQMVDRLPTNNVCQHCGHLPHANRCEQQALFEQDRCQCSVRQTRWPKRRR